MPTNSIASPPARIAKASKPTTKSNPDVFSIKLNCSPIKSHHRYLLIAECLPTMGKRRKKQTLKFEKKHIAVLKRGEVGPMPYAHGGLCPMPTEAYAR
jgi:hypothetical protein